MHDLPSHIFGKICRFLKKKTILQLRQVCKRVKTTTEEFVTAFVSTQPVEVQLKARAMANGNMEIDFFFRYGCNFLERGPFFWKLCLMSVLGKIEMNPTTCISRGSFPMCISMQWIDMKRFLASVKPLFTNENIIVGLGISNDPQDIELEVIYVLSDFLHGKTLLCVDAYYYLKNYTPQMQEWLRFFNKIHTESVHFFLEILNKESVKFLLEISNNIESINIGINGKNHSTNDILLIIKEMLNRKTTKITVSGNQPLTSNNIEQLVQFANLCNKKIDITVENDVRFFLCQVGVYKVNYEYRRIEIAHL